MGIEKLGRARRDLGSYAVKVGPFQKGVIPIPGAVQPGEGCSVGASRNAVDGPLARESRPASRARLVAPNLPLWYLK